MTPHGSIAVIIVNYGTAELAIAAVESVLARRHGGRFVGIHVVDNASPGSDSRDLEAARRARGWGARVRLWPETENLGFGRGNNVVLEALANAGHPPEFVFLLNPDARLANEALDILAAKLEACPGAAAAGAGIALPDGTPATSAFRFPSPLSELAEIVSFGPLDRLLARHRVPLSPDLPEGAVDWVSGAAAMFRFSALVEVGFFDPDFFLYFEETEMQNRLGRAGWKMLFVPQASVVHEEGAATGQFRGGRRVQPAYLYRSRWMYAEKTRGRLNALATALLVVPAAVINILHRRLRGRKPTLPLRFFRDHWRHGILPLLKSRTSA